MRREFVLDGSKFHDMEGFYCEIDRLFTKNLGWKTGHNLDAFNDILRGGFGVHKCGEPVRIIWKNFASSRENFGYGATARYYENMLTTCHPANTDLVQSKLTAAKNGIGETLLDMLVGIITDTDDSGHDCELVTVD